MFLGSWQSSAALVLDLRVRSRRPQVPPFPCMWLRIKPRDQLFGMPRKPFQSLCVGTRWITQRKLLTIDHKYLDEVGRQHCRKLEKIYRELTEVARLELFSQRHCDAV